MNEEQYQHERSEPRREPPKGVTSLPRISFSDDDTKAIDSYIASRGLSVEVASSNGWYPSRCAGDSYLRIVMPATNTLGYVYWQARAIDPETRLRYRSPYYASGDSIIVVWPSTPKRRVALVEGPFDALAAAEHGWIGVALMGKQPQTEVYDHICTRFPGHELIVVADADGIEAAGQIVGTLAARGIPAQFKLTGYKDLAAMPAEHRRLLLEW